jgi:hypothetical protein
MDASTALDDLLSLRTALYEAGERDLVSVFDDSLIAARLIEAAQQRLQQVASMCSRGRTIRKP